MNDVAEEIGGSRLLVETKGEKKTREKNLRISCVYVVFKCYVLITGYHNFKDFYNFLLLLLENEIIMIYDGTEFLL